MLQTTTFLNSELSFSFFGKKKGDDVDKGSNRKTPGKSEGAKPPKTEDFKKIQVENDREKDVQEETVDNEERDKNK